MYQFKNYKQSKYLKYAYGWRFIIKNNIFDIKF